MNTFEWGREFERCLLGARVELAIEVNRRRARTLERVGLSHTSRSSIFFMSLFALFQCFIWPGGDTSLGRKKPTPVRCVSGGDFAHSNWPDPNPRAASRIGSLGVSVPDEQTNTTRTWNTKTTTSGVKLHSRPSRARRHR